MALSEGEQRRLDEIERALKVDDPKFAANITIDRLRRHGVYVSAILFVLGMVGLVAGLVIADASVVVGIVIAVLGAAAMAGAVILYFLPRYRR